MATVAVSSSSQLAADAGASIAAAGGNAVDAALAAVLVSMVTEIGVIGPGASGFIALHPPGTDPVVIDAYAEMPGRGLPPERLGNGAERVWIGYGGGMETIVGWGSVATPGAFAGMALAHERYGNVPWSILFDPAIAACREGFHLSAASGRYMAHAAERVYGWQQESRDVVVDDGQVVQAGDLIHIPQLAGALERIAEHPRDLYEGDLARMLAEACEEGGGILTRSDLEAYRPIIRRPVLVDIHGWRVATNPAPAVGGVTMAAMVLLMDGEAPNGWDRDSLQTYARVQRSVLRYRRDHLSNHHHRAEAARHLLDLARSGRDDELLSSPSTVHTSAVDSNGWAVAMTISAGYGSGAMIPGTGFWMNNSLGEIEIIPEGFHALQPGTRLVSNMAPTVARHADGSAIAIGSPGADRITTAIASVLLNHLELGMPLQRAVEHQRMHVEVFGGSPTIAFEHGLAVERFEDLATREFPEPNMYFGGVAAAAFHPDEGVLGAADPRRAGGVAIATRTYG